MMTVNKITAFTLLLFCCSFISRSQVDGTKPLSGNSILQNHKQKNTTNSQKSSSASVFLPFSDDFSYWGPYPDANKWQTSQSVFINRTYPIAPPTIGVATFDGLSRFGYPYNISATGGSFSSDTLMSVPIRLDFTDASQTVPITPADSVYLSFFYQAKGRGDTPEQNDVLSLFFIAPDDTSSNFISGTPVWSKSGYSIGLPSNDTGFHRVMIPIYRSKDDTVFFQDTGLVKTGFRFAFVNWGTQCGAIDHWHIDGVYMQGGRTVNDTVFPDVSFVYDQSSLLKNYMQMPYNQFAGVGDMDTVVRAVLRNNNNIKTTTGNQWNGAVNVSTGYEILDVASNIVKSVPVNGNNNVFNYDSIGYCKDNALIRPSLGGFTYNVGPFTDTTSFLLKFFINVAPSTGQLNDTAHFRQSFQNYYAYDDGTAEAAYYGPFVNGSTQIAVKYKLNVADTLRAMDIFFDPVAGVNFIQSLDLGLVVWADNAGHPGSPILFDSSSVLSATAFPHPVFSKNGYDIFARYQLSKAVPLDTGTTFYIGTYQTFSTQLGIGLDLNHDAHKNIFYYNGSGWNTASCTNCNGSLMIRPVFGDSLSTIGVETYADPKKQAKIYPNPATDEIFISSSDKITKVLIIDLLGNTLLEEKNNTEKITVSAMPDGLYLIRTFNAKGSGFTQKLIISR